MEPWEESLSLDVDSDSDSPSILRPCKRQHIPQSQPSFTTSQSDTLLTPLNTETLAGSQRPPPVPRTIPGPAGAVLAALQRRSEISETETEEGNPISTQEYLRKAMDGSASNSEFDDDFKNACWVAALDFSDRENGELASSAKVLLAAVKNCGTKKLPKVVAMIKTCTPNGFGDFMVTLKDPSGTISASIHRSVVVEGGFGNCIAVGAVLVLRKVSIFCPRNDYYLNITVNNVVKIFPKDYESLSNTGSGLEATTNFRVPASVAKSPLAHNSSSMGIQLTSGGLNNQIDGGVINFRRPSVQLDRNNSTDDATSRSVGNIEKESNLTGDASMLHSYTNTNNSTQPAAMDSNNDSTLQNKQPGNTTKKAQKSSDDAGKCNEASNLMRPLASLSSLPQWTDEQLEELLMDD